ncbi:MAG: hypothetical protein WCD89_22195 [Anaerocolumna sp.]
MKVKKKIASVISLVLVLGFIMGTNAFAATDQIITVGKDMTWKDVDYLYRSGLDPYITASCSSVYPDSGTDNFTRIQVGLKRTPNSPSPDTIINWGGYYVLYEGEGDTKVQILDNYLSAYNIRICFRGNDPDYGANAVVSYSTR